MTTHEILKLRLYNQQLNGSKIKTPEEMVVWFGAVQAQDFTGAKWALGQRLEGSSDKSIETSFNDGEILRTHVMRPTWHFVAPADIYWLLELTAPRVKLLMNYYNKKLGLTSDVFQKGRKVFEKALGNGESLTRSELAESLEKSGIKARGQMLGHLVMEAELDGLIVSGPRRGKQFTYMLMDIRAPKFKTFSRDEALSLIVKKYFQSHGPATVKDFCWWSGLTAIDAKKGIEMNRSMKHENVDGIEYHYFGKDAPKIPDNVYLLPNYDEYGIAYKNREIFLRESGYKIPPSAGQLQYPHMIFQNGILVGLWKRILKSKTIEIETQLFSEDKNLKEKINKSFQDYKSFLGF